MSTAKTIQAVGYAANDTTGTLTPLQFTRRSPTEHDVVIKIRWAGICHSDIHTAKGEWGPVKYPLVPGHEIVGHVSEVGSAVTKWKVGDTVGVGCMVDSCQSCHMCKAGEEQFCSGPATFTYNGTDKYGQPTAGGYSYVVVVDEKFVLRIPENLDLAGAAPLLCAGITTYSPLVHWGVKKGSKVGVAGLGGLGHMAVKIAAALGAEVTVISSSDNKRPDAEKLGAHKFFITREAEQWKTYTGYFDVIIDTISAPHDVEKYINTLAVDGKIVLVGLPTEPMKLSAFPFVMGRRALAGSLIGGIRETQEMLDFCGKHNITSDIEIISPQQLNEAWKRVIASDVKYRFVIDVTQL